MNFSLTWDTNKSIQGRLTIPEDLAIYEKGQWNNYINTFIEININIHTNVYFKQCSKWFL
jgi:hypothetical protein